MVRGAAQTRRHCRRSRGADHASTMAIATSCPTPGRCSRPMDSGPPCSWPPITSAAGRSGTGPMGEPAALLGWDELRGLAAAGLEVGAHGRTHAYPTRLSEARMVAEGRESRRRLEAELGRPVTLMAYPFGDENRMVRRAMAGCGYVAALTTRPGLSRLGDNPMGMPRQLVGGRRRSGRVHREARAPHPGNPRSPRALRLPAAGANEPDVAGPTACATAFSHPSDGPPC